MSKNHILYGPVIYYLLNPIVMRWPSMPARTDPHGSHSVQIRTAIFDVQFQYLKTDQEKKHNF